MIRVIIASQPLANSQESPSGGCSLDPFEGRRAHHHSTKTSCRARQRPKSLISQWQRPQRRGGARGKCAPLGALRSLQNRVSANAAAAALKRAPHSGAPDNSI